MNGLGSAYIVMNRLLAERWVLQAVLVRALDASIFRNWRKGDPCYIWQNFWLTVIWEATYKMRLGFFLMLSIKCEGKRDKLREKLFIKKIKKNEDL